MKTADISVIIPQYGCWEQTVHCCASLLRFHQQPIDLIVIDDGSPPEDLKQSRQYLPDSVRLISQSHQGVTAAWNLGLKSSQTRYAVLLNNDVVTKSSWLTDLQLILDQSPHSLVGASWYYAKGQLLLQKKLGLECLSQRLLAGWCLGFSRDTAEQIGSFDENMKLYWSDTDWQLRWLEYHRGQAEILKCLPLNALWHQGHVTVKAMISGREQWKQDRRVFFTKWQPHSS